MKVLVNSLSVDDIIDFHNTASELMKHQISEAGEDWLIVLNNRIGIEKIYRWSIFVGRAIGEDFRQDEFQTKARELSILLQERFSKLGLDISLWSPVFFYLGMIYTYSKHIGFVKITHLEKPSKLKVLSRLDHNFAEAINPDSDHDFLFIDSKKQDPITITMELIEMNIINIKKIEIFTVVPIKLGEEFFDIHEIVYHIPKELDTAGFTTTSHISFVTY